MHTMMHQDMPVGREVVIVRSGCEGWAENAVEFTEIIARGQIKSVGRKQVTVATESGDVQRFWIESTFRTKGQPPYATRFVLAEQAG